MSVVDDRLFNVVLWSHDASNAMLIIFIDPLQISWLRIDILKR